MKDFLIHKAGDAAVSANVGLANAVGTWHFRSQSHDLQAESLCHKQQPNFVGGHLTRLSLLS